jgi:chemotaxis protein methyltransferase CheR
VTPTDYEYLCRFLKDRSGLVLAAEKGYLVESRLAPVARRNGYANVSELVHRVMANASDALRVEVVEAMMNNESFFFRDRIPFERMRDTILPHLMVKRAAQKQIRIWCAACSFGQEPYSVAMVLDDYPGIEGWQVDILATDISNDALEQARSGLYSQFEVQRGLPIQMLMRHFEQIDDQWQIGEKLRRRIQFRQSNLMSDFSSLGRFDVVFCRNVLIYFDHATKIDVLSRVRRAMPTDGYLVLGAAETMVGLGNDFLPVPEKRALYQPNNRPAPPLQPTLKPVSGGIRVS